MKAALALLAVLTAGCSTSVANAQPETQRRLEDLRAQGWSISEPLTVRDIEAKELAEIRKARLGGLKDIPEVPFGFDNDRWGQFKLQIKPGDEIHHLAAPSEYGQLLEGYVLVRRGAIVADFVTRIEINN